MTDDKSFFSEAMGCRRHSGILTIEQKVCPNVVYYCGDIITFWISVSNESDRCAENVTVFNSLNDMCYVENSTSVAGGCVKNDSPVNGIEIGKIKAHSSVLVSFKAAVTDFSKYEIKNASVICAEIGCRPVKKKSEVSVILVSPHSRYENFDITFLTCDMTCITDVYASLKSVNFSADSSLSVVTATYAVTLKYKTCESEIKEITKEKAVTFVVPSETFSEDDFKVDIIRLCKTEECSAVTLSGTIKLDFCGHKTV